MIVLHDWSWLPGVFSTVITALGFLATQLSNSGDRIRSDRDKYYDYWKAEETKNTELMNENLNLKIENVQLKEKLNKRGKENE